MLPRQLLGKRLRLTLAPTLAANQGVGVFLFSLEGEPGFPLLDGITMEAVGGHGKQRIEEADVLEQGVTPAGAWQALLRYEGFLSPGMGGPEFVAPKKFVIHKAVGKLKGEEIDLLGCLEVAPLKRLPVIVRENKSIP